MLNRPSFDPKGYIWIVNAEDLLGRSIYGQDWCPSWALPTKWMLPPPSSEEADTERAKIGALSYLAMRSIEDQALSHIAREGLRIPTLAAEGLRKAGIALPTAWQEMTEDLENLPVMAEVYALAYRLDREVRLFWEMVENIRGSIVRNCEAGKILTFARAEAGGELTQLPAHIWSMQFWDQRFDSGAVDLLKPFPRRPDYIEFHHDPVKKKWTRLHIGAEERDRATTDLHWIFFESESFAQAYGTPSSKDTQQEDSAALAEIIGEHQQAPTSLPEAVTRAKGELAKNDKHGKVILEAILSLGWPSWPIMTDTAAIDAILGTIEGEKKNKPKDVTIKRIIKRFSLDGYR